MDLSVGYVFDEFARYVSNKGKKPMFRLIGFAGVPGAGKDTAANYVKSKFPNVYILKHAHPLQDFAAIMAGLYDPVNEMHRVLFEDQNWKNTKSIDVSKFKNDLVYRHELLVDIVDMLTGLPYRNKYQSNAKTLTIGEQVFTGEFIYDALDTGFKEYITEDLYSPRDLQKLFGTEVCRKYIHEDIWVVILEDKLVVMPDNALVLITDARHINELEMLGNWNGKLVYIVNDTAYAKAEEMNLFAHPSEANHDLYKSKADYLAVNMFGDLPAFYKRIEAIVSDILGEEYHVC